MYLFCGNIRYMYEYSEIFIHMAGDRTRSRQAQRLKKITMVMQQIKHGYCSSTMYPQINHGFATL